MTMNRKLSTIIFLFIILAIPFQADAGRFDFRFRNTPLSEALSEIARADPKLNLNFIYNELENYRVNADINTDDGADAVRKAVGRNPVSVIVRRKSIFVEAMQKGKYRFTGRAVGENGQPVPYANVMLLTPKDSVVITHGATDVNGFFSIPCDRTGIIAKLSSVGFRTTFRRCDRFTLGDIVMPIKEINLKNVTVKPDTRYIDGDKSVFIPSKREKNAAHGGQSLLLSMAIPTIVVNPIDKSITDRTGQGVATFIDYLPATSQQISDLRPQDVLRVEVLDSPADPRFEGALHVINFIMVKYEYGGYTKINASEETVIPSGSVNMSSKFSHKRMTYDVAAGYSFFRSHHDGSSIKTIYGMPEGDVVRDENTTSSLRENHNPYASMRAVYSTEKTTVSNTLGFQYRNSPENYDEIATTFSSPAYISSVARSNTRRKNISPSFSGTYHFLLPRNFGLIISPSATYGHNTSDYYYTDGSDMVVNDVKENAYTAFMSVLAQKNWGPQSVGFSVNGEMAGNRITYTGSNPATVKSSRRAIGMRLRGNISFGGFRLNADVKCFFNRTSFDSSYISEWLPGYYLYGSYTFNKKNSISFSSEMSSWTIPITERSPNIVVRNQIDAIQGNPSLRAFRYNACDLRYQWIPRQNFAVSLFSRFYRHDKPVTRVYVPTEIDGHTMMLRSYKRDGFYADLSYGLGTWLSLFDSSLTLSGSLYAHSVSRRGMIHHTQSYVAFDLQAYYYLKNFYFSAYYRYRDKYVSASSISTSPSFYRVSVGWSRNGFNVSLSADNIFRSDWLSNSSYALYPRYACTTFGYSSSSHRSFVIDLSYSFSYGKKLRQTDELRRSGWAPSGIVE